MRINLKTGKEEWSYCDWPETAEKHFCRSCCTYGICDVSGHFYLDVDKIAVRCRYCRKMWDVDPDQIEIRCPDGSTAMGWKGVITWH